MFHCSNEGIELYSSSGITVTGNNVENNTVGLRIHQSSYATISGNAIIGNEHGFYISQSENKFIYRNVIDNAKQILTDRFRNIWDSGYLLGDNYWSDYSGTDENRDGIGDTPYVIDKNNQDNFPLMIH